MNVQVAVLCDAATDEQGKLNLLGTFDTLCTAKLPAIQAQCAVALRLAFQLGEEGQHNLKLNFVDADGRPVMPAIQIGMSVSFPEDAHFVSRNFIFHIQQLRYEKPGLYAVDVMLGDKSIASIPLTVKMLNPAPKTEE